MYSKYLKMKDETLRAAERAQEVERLAAKPDNQSSVPGAHVVGEKHFCELTDDFHMYAVVYMPASWHACTRTQILNK